MKRLTFIVTIVLAAATSLAKSAYASNTDKSLEMLQRLVTKIQDHRMEADYSFSVVSNGAEILYSGHAVMQGKCFFLSGNGMNIYCDGETIHCLDPGSKEAYIENAVKLEDYIKSNVSSIANLKISNLRENPASDDLTAFTAPKLDNTWVLTDLR